VGQLYPDATIITAVSGDEALQKVEGIPFEVATIDYNMPGMDGLALIEKLRRDQPEARFALLTANIQDSGAQRAANLGVEFINKPVTEKSITRFLAEKGERACSS